ncbi:MAG: hypothetical protein KME64_04045 [Scytonematopsis contorta HA4267-MV1]|jgi:hypothetical protein|nr:hypothetical protein [Scytonematopsis contorta HA4267-MV1]
MIKSRLLLLSGITYVICSAIVSNIQIVQAAPVQIFTQVVKDIRRQLPRNLVVRLPSSIPNKIIKAGKIQPDLKIEKDSISLKLKYVGCEKDFPGGRGYALNCLPLSFSFGTIGSKLYKESEFYRTSGTKFSLGSGVIANHFQGDGFNVISWVQNKTYFATSSGQISLNELKSIARSMVNELPITSKK